MTIVNTSRMHELPLHDQHVHTVTIHTVQSTTGHCPLSGASRRVCPTVQFQLIRLIRFTSPRQAYKVGSSQRTSEFASKVSIDGTRLSVL